MGGYFPLCSYLAAGSDYKNYQTLVTMNVKQGSGKNSGHSNQSNIVCYSYICTFRLNSNNFQHSLIGSHAGDFSDKDFTLPAFASRNTVCAERTDVCAILSDKICIEHMKWEEVAYFPCQMEARQGSAGNQFITGLRILHNLNKAQTIHQEQNERAGMSHA